MYSLRPRYRDPLLLLCCLIVSVLYALAGNWHLLLVLISFSFALIAAIFFRPHRLRLLFLLNGIAAALVSLTQLPERASFFYAEPSHLALAQVLIFLSLCKLNARYLAALNLIPLILSQSTSGLLLLPLLSVALFDLKKRGLLFLFAGALCVVAVLSVEQINDRVVNLLDYLQGRDQVVNSASIRTSSFLAIFQFIDSPILRFLLGFGDAYHEIVGLVYYQIISDTPHEDLYNAVAVLLYKNGSIGFLVSLAFMVASVRASRMKIGIPVFFYACLVVSFFSGYVVGPMAIIFYFLILILVRKYAAESALRQS